MGSEMCIRDSKIAKAGGSFMSYTKDLAAMRLCGTEVPQCRSSRDIARRLVDCAAEELVEQDKELVDVATSIALTMDERAGFHVIRARLTLGNGCHA